MEQQREVIDATAVSEEWDDLFGPQSSPQLPAPVRPDAYAAYVAIARAGGGRGDPTRLQKLAIRVGELCGEDGVYSFPAGSSRIEGPTIKLAKALANAWGSVGFGVEIERIEKDRVYLTGVCVDFLTLTVVRRGSTFALSPASGGFAKSADQRTRWETMQVQAGGSRALRGAILDCLPTWFVDPAFQAAKAKDTGLKPGQTIEVARDEAVKVLRGFGVSREQAEHLVGSPVIQWSPSDLRELRSLIRAVRDGETTFEEALAAVGPMASAATPSGDRLAGVGLGSKPAAQPPPPSPPPAGAAPGASAAAGGQAAGAQGGGSPASDARTAAIERLRVAQRALPEATARDVLASHGLSRLMPSATLERIAACARDLEQTAERLANPAPTVNVSDDLPPEAGDEAGEAPLTRQELLDEVAEFMRGFTADEGAAVLDEVGVQGVASATDDQLRRLLDALVARVPTGSSS